LNFKVIGQGLAGFGVFFSVRDAAANPEQYLALSKARWSCCYGMLCCYWNKFYYPWPWSHRAFICIDESVLHADINKWQQ